jgi:hypothetical protein
VQIPEQFLQSSMSRLQSLHLDMNTINSATITELSLMPALQHLCLRDKAWERSYMNKQLIRHWTPQQEQLLEDLRQRCKQVQIFFDDESTYEKIFEDPNSISKLPSWDSAHWRGKE